MYDQMTTKFGGSLRRDFRPGCRLHADENGDATRRS